MSNDSSDTTCNSVSLARFVLMWTCTTEHHDHADIEMHGQGKAARASHIITMSSASINCCHMYMTEIQPLHAFTTHLRQRGSST